MNITRIKTAALHHEIVHDAVKHRAVVMPVFDVLQEIGHRLGRFVWVNLDGEFAFAGNELDARGFSGGLGQRVARQGEQSGQS